jgi:hypothetical protein
VTVGGPIAAQQVESGLGEREVAVLSAFASVDMDHHAGAIDIGDFEMESFLKSQAAGVHGGEIGMVVGGLDVGKNASDFFDAQDSREATFILGSKDTEDVPTAVKHVLVEEADTAVADAHGLGGPSVDVFAVEEVVLEFLLGEQVGGFAIEPGKHADRACVGLLSPFPFPVEL